MLGDGYWLSAVGRYSAQRGHNNAAGREPARRPPQGGRKDACNGNRSRGSGNPVRFLNGQVVLSLVEKLPSALNRDLFRSEEPPRWGSLQPSSNSSR